MQATLAEIQQIIDQRIGPAQNMGFTVGDYDGHALTMHAPLESNMNHHGTGFGGSLYAIAAVAGWALVLTKLREHDTDGTIVIRQANIQYERPVTEDFTIRVAEPEDGALDAFVARYQADDAARVTLRAEIHNRGKRAVLFEGEFSIKNMKQQL